MNSTLNVLPCISVRNQFWLHIKASNVSSFNLLCCGVTTRPLVLMADSEATVEIGIAKKSLAIFYVDKVKFYACNFFFYDK